MVARGTGEASGSGKMGLIASGVAAVVPGSVISPVEYPASTDYYDSAAVGVTMMTLHDRAVRQGLSRREDCPAGLLSGLLLLSLVIHP